LQPRATVSLPIRLRLGLVTAVLLTAALAGLGALVYLRLESDLVAAADDGLAERAEALIGDPPSGPEIAEDASDVGDVFAAIQDAAGSVAAASADYPSQALLSQAEIADLARPRSLERVITGDEEPTPVRMLATPLGDGRVLITGVAFDDQRSALDSLRDELIVALPIAAILALVAGWLVGRAALRPVERLRIEAEAISESDLSRRLHLPGTRDELAALGRSLNRMLERLEAAVERERLLVDDASHELRTPLANLRAELELALRRARTEPELLEAIRSALDETERLSRLAGDLLVLARAQRGQLPVRPSDVALHELVASAVGAASGRAEAARIKLETTVAPGLAAHVDPDRLRQALDNLIDNALRLTPAGGTVVVTAERVDGSLRIAVADTGPGFPEAFLPDAFEPFSRTDAGRTRSYGGAGLGLSIVRAVAEAHHGTASAANLPGGGALVELRLPA
jgi:hypothetical protein